MDVFRSVLVVDVNNPDGLVDEDGRPVPPRLDQVCRQWGLDIAEVIFGAYDAETGEQRIREVLLKVPKKNWKSGWAAAVMLTLSIRNWRSSNQGAIIAPTKDTADNCFDVMRDAIRADPDLEKLFHIQTNLRTIRHRVTGMTCRVYAADTDTISGKKWAFVIFEELWLLAQRKGAKDMIVEATGGQASRLEGIVISITTESDEDPIGIYKEKLDYARAVRDGEIIAPHFLPILYEWPEDMLKAKAYMEPDNWPLVNPNWGASVDPVDFHNKFDQAKDAGGDSLALFLAKRLNVPPSENRGGSWAGARFWSNQGTAGLNLDQVLARSEVVTIGIDGGGLDDLLGLSVLGREFKTGNWLHWGHAWAHPIVLERHEQEAERFQDYDAAGHMTIVDKIGQDIEEVVAIVKKCEDAGLLDRVGVDPAGLGSIVDNLCDVEGGPRLDRETRVIGISQGWRLNGAIKATERKLAEGTFFHGDSDLMAWCIGNCKTSPAGNAVLVTKQYSGNAKIDPVSAIFDSVQLMCQNPQPRRKSYGMLFLGG
jgi:phage terminase large subunit-like protein